MDVITTIVILIGLGCIFMGVILLSQKPIEPPNKSDESREPRQSEQSRQSRQSGLSRQSSAHRFWLQETRDQHEQLPSFPVF
jgi:hypothetical protein